MFISPQNFGDFTWQSFERVVCRLLLHQGYDSVRLVGQTGDRGADVLAHRFAKRWVVQVKHWKTAAGVDVVDQTYDALRTYRAQIPVIVSRTGFTEEARAHQLVLQSERIPLQLWDRPRLLELAQQLPNDAPCERLPEQFGTRDYQEEAIKRVVKAFVEDEGRALVVMATGLGKTRVAAEAFRRICASRPIRLLAIAHTNDLVYQLERSFWPFLKGNQDTLVWNGLEHPRPEAIERATCVFACLPTVADWIARGSELPHFDMVLIDECHHVGANMYESILRESRAGQPGGPFLFGVTATPWRPDEVELERYFGQPLISVDLVTGMKLGFLANVDYRMHTDNIDWASLVGLKGKAFSPKAINRTLFLNQWDDAVVFELQRVWQEQRNPRAIVFCGTIDHALRMRDRIRALGFCNAEAIYSGSAASGALKPYERNKILCDFDDGTVNVVCAVDIFNEGVDVPDVNIIVFQRVTHSRRIFVQQLGRGLRIAPDKDRVIVLDFVSDIRRFAAGLELKDRLEEGSRGPRSQTVDLPHKVSFRRVGGDDPETESFLREWLEDAAAVAELGEDASVLKYPPALPGAKG